MQSHENSKQTIPFKNCNSERILPYDVDRTATSLIAEPTKTRAIQTVRQSHDRDS